jgi:hypothetical protein
MATSTMLELPVGITEDHLTYLDRLRESGRTKYVWRRRIYNPSIWVFKSRS